MRSHWMLLPLLLVFLGVIEASSSCSGTLSSCEESTAKDFFSAQGCQCFTCNEVNGDMTYSCKSPSSKMCSGVAQVSTDAEVTNLHWTNENYGIIVVVYIVVCAFAYGIVSLMARVFPSQVFQKDAAARCDIIAIITSKLRGFFIDPVLEDDQAVRGFFEYFVTENELLNTFCLGCCPKPKLGNKFRPFLYRLSIVIAGILITISIGQLFDRSLVLLAVVLKRDFYGGPEPNIVHNDQLMRLDLAGRLVLFIDLHSHNISGTGSGFITSNMLETFIARSGPDMALHIFNVVFAVVWVAIAFGISAGMLQESPTKSAALRMKTIAGITISTWFQGQVYTLVQIPAFYILRVLCYGLFGSAPEEDPQEKPKDTGGAVVFPHQVEMDPIHQLDAAQPSTCLQTSVFAHNERCD